MTTNCLNCGTEIQDKFCPHCGQKKEVEKLTWHSLLHELFHFFSHIGEGFLNTSWHSIIHPGKVIRGYLDGKRKKYHKPIGFFLIWTALHLLTYELVIRWMGYENLRKGNFLFTSGEAGDYIYLHPNTFGLLLLPILAFFIWLIVGRPKMNYIESFVLAVYMMAVFEIFVIFQILIIGLLFQINFRTNSFLIQVQIVNMIWAFFASLDFFKKEKIKFLVFRILLAEGIGLIVFHKLSALIANLILIYKH